MIRIPQNRFNRAQRKLKLPVLPERLQRLNLELGKERSKDFDYLFFVRQKLRVRVCVMRDEDDKFFATAQIGSKAFRIQGGSPSGAFYTLEIVLRIHIASLPSVERRNLLVGGAGQ